MKRTPEDSPVRVRALPHAPEDLTRGRLRRLGEGIGKVVYASDHWVVKRKRRPSEIMALIFLWKTIRRIEGFLPGSLGQRLLEKSGTQLRLLRFLVQGLVLVVPRGVWFATHMGETWRWYTAGEARGKILSDTYLAGTPLVPEVVSFPPTKVRIGAWPGWMVVSEATERVEATLHDRINDLARSLRFEEIEVWLDRLLKARKAGWERGVFSMDAHLKNFGVVDDRVVLLDVGGLTNRWPEIQRRLARQDELECPHVHLGLEMTLRDRPEVADRFDKQWRAAVNAETVRLAWPTAGTRR